MIFRGLEPVTLIDFPGHIATVLFTGGCNFRCPFCHNAALVLAPETLPRYEETDVLRLLEQRFGLVDGVVVSGGEPTLQAGLAGFLRQVRQLGLAIKLDTNGSRPNVLRALLDEGLLDYVAMDVKAPPEKYARLAGLPGLNLKEVEQSIALLRESEVACEFRTTVIPDWLVEEDVTEIACWLQGAKQFVIQQFRPQHTLDLSLEHAVPYPKQQFQAMADHASQWVGHVTVRGS